MKSILISLALFFSPLQENGGAVLQHLQTNFLQDLWQKFVEEKWDKQKDFWHTFEDFHLPTETVREFRDLHQSWESETAFLLKLTQDSGKNNELYEASLKESIDIFQEGKTNESKTSVSRELTSVLDAVCEVCQLQGVNLSEVHDLCLRACQ